MRSVAVKALETAVKLLTQVTIIGIIDTSHYNRNHCLYGCCLVLPVIRLLKSDHPRPKS